MKKRVILLLLVGVLLLSACSKVPEDQTDTGAEMGQEADAVTDELRETYFDLARTYRFDYIPAFEEGEQLTPEDLTFYTAVRFWNDIEKGSGVKGGKIKEISGLFDMTRIPDEDEIFPLGIGSVNGAPLMEAGSYQREQKDGKTYVTVDLKAHYFSDLDQTMDAEEQAALVSVYQEGYTYPKNELAVYELMEDSELTFFEAAKELIVKGKSDQLSEVQTTIRLCYETSDGKTPERFVSCEKIVI